MADIQGLNTEGGGNVGGASFENSFVDDRQSLIDAHRRNVSLGLLAAGLATLAHRDYGKGAAIRALGAGGLTGLSAYEQGEATTAQEAQRRMQQRALEQFRQGELQNRQQQLQIQNEQRKIQLAGEQEKARHDAEVERTNQQLRQIQEQNAQTAVTRANAEQQRVGIEAGKLGVERARAGIEQQKFEAGQTPLGAPTSTNLLKAYKVPNADELGKAVGTLPRDQAMKAINTAVMAQKSNLKPQHYVDKNNQLHVYAVDNAGNKAFDSVIGEVQPKGKGSTAGNLADQINAAVNGTPSPSTPETNPTPAPESAKAATTGKRLGAVDATKYPNGTYRNPTTGRRVIVRDGVAYDEAS